MRLGNRLWSRLCGECVALAALPVDSERDRGVIKSERDFHPVVFTLMSIAGYHHTRLANVEFCRIALTKGVDAKKTFALNRGEYVC